MSTHPRIDITDFKKQFHFATKKYTNAITESFFYKVREELYTWESSLKKALSKQVSDSTIKNRKTRPNNPFPHYNGEKYKPDGYPDYPALRDTVYAYTTMHSSSSGKSNSVIARMQVGQDSSGGILPSAFYTTRGMRHRKDGSSPGWENWLDRVTRPFNEDNQSSLDIEGIKIKSMYDIMDELVSERLKIK